MLLYLNERTFIGEAGEALASEVRLARHGGLPLLMIHEIDPEKGGVGEFGKFFQTTPDDLIRDGIYKSSLAIAFHEAPHRTASIRLAAKVLGGGKMAPHQALVRLKSNLSKSNLSSEGMAKRRWSDSGAKGGIRRRLSDAKEDRETRRSSIGASIKPGGCCPSVSEDSEAVREDSAATAGGAPAEALRKTRFRLTARSDGAPGKRPIVEVELETGDAPTAVSP